jgi:hypothetical protein
MTKLKLIRAVRRTERKADALRAAAYYAGQAARAVPVWRQAEFDQLSGKAERLARLSNRFLSLSNQYADRLTSLRTAELAA